MKKIHPVTVLLLGATPVLAGSVSLTAALGMCLAVILITFFSREIFCQAGVSNTPSTLTVLLCFYLYCIISERKAYHILNSMVKH